MKDEHIELFFESVISVFDTMVGCELTPKESYIKDGS